MRCVFDQRDGDRRRHGSAATVIALVTWVVCYAVFNRLKVPRSRRSCERTRHAPAIRGRAASSKYFRIYRRRETTLKEALIRRRRGVYEEFKAVDDVSFDVADGPGARHLRPQRLGQVDAAEDAGAHPRARRGDDRGQGPRRGAARGRRRLPPRVLRDREHLPERRDLRHVARAARAAGRRHHRLRRSSSASPTTRSRRTRAACTRGSGFAIAVNVDPDVLLIDEVLAVGDQSFRLRCYERMLAFREAGKTLILVTHDLGAIASFCEPRDLARRGPIRGEATPEAITRRYVAEVTARRSCWSAQQAAAGRGPVDVPPADQRHGADQPELDEHRGRRRHRARRLPQRRGASGCGSTTSRSNPVRSPIFEVAIHRHDGDACHDRVDPDGRVRPRRRPRGRGLPRVADRRSPADARLVLPLAAADRPDRPARARRARALVPLPGARRDATSRRVAARSCPRAGRTCARERASAGSASTWGSRPRAPSRRRRVGALTRSDDRRAQPSSWSPCNQYEHVSRTVTGGPNDAGAADSVRKSTAMREARSRIAAYGRRLSCRNPASVRSR